MNQRLKGNRVISPLSDASDFNHLRVAAENNHAKVKEQLKVKEQRQDKGTNGADVNSTSDKYMVNFCCVDQHFEVDQILCMCECMSLCLFVCVSYYHSVSLSV